MNERIGKYWILSSMNVDGVKHYFISSKKIGDIRWVYTDSEKAVDKFEEVENRAEKRGEI